MLRPYITHQILPWNGSTLIKTSKKKGCLIREIICMRHDSPNHWRMLHTDMLATHKNKWNIPTHTFPSSLSGRRFCGSLRSFLSFNTMLSLNSTFIWAYWAYIHKCGPCSNPHWHTCVSAVHRWLWVFVWKSWYSSVSSSIPRICFFSSFAFAYPWGQSSTFICLIMRF